VGKLSFVTARLSHDPEVPPNNDPKTHPKKAKEDEPEGGGKAKDHFQNPEDHHKDQHTGQAPSRLSQVENPFSAALDALNFFTQRFY
jgi:hypothetical protein